MYAHKLTVVALAIGATLAFGIPAKAADLPRSGTIKIHSNLKANEQVVQVGEKHFMASGNGWGVAYNDAGSGPLHMGAWFCTFTGDDVNGSFINGGACAFADAGGADKIFIVWSGKGTDNVGEQGTGTITGGAGKYAGIEGKMVWQCKPIDAAQGLSACTQQFDYQLASATQ